VLLILVAANILNVTVLLIHAPVPLRFPAELEYEEGNILNGGVRVLDGFTPYSEPSYFPIVINPYGPVLHMVVSKIVAWKGIGFFYPRLFVALTGVLVAVLLALVIRTYSGSLLTGAAFGLLYLALPLVQNWLFLLRVDFPALMFSLAGLYVFSRAERHWLLADLLFVVALFTKHTMIAAPLACFVFLLLRREYRSAIRLAVAYAGLALLAALVTEWWWTGDRVWFHLLRTHPDPYSSHTYSVYVYRLLGVKLVALAFTLPLAFLQLKRGRTLLPLLYLALSWVVSLTAGKLGSSSNHFIEAIAAACVCLGLAVHALIACPMPTRMIRAVS
jgi:hypothetical protein